MTKHLCLVHSELHHLHRPRHQVEWGLNFEHPDQPDRIDTILNELLKLEGSVSFESDYLATPSELAQVHAPDLIEFLMTFENAWNPSWNTELIPDSFAWNSGSRSPERIEARTGYYCYDTATPLLPGTIRAARAAVGCAIMGAEELLTGAYKRAYALCRPPGHHAMRGKYGGFCYLNNSAVAALRLLPSGRVAILDLDYHHGNGTQDIFYETSTVLYTSLHADPNHHFPYFSGYAEETGKGAGEGFTANYPMPESASFDQYRCCLDLALNLITKKACACLVVSMGYDTAGGDPLGDLGLQPEEYHTIGLTIASLGLPILVVQEGGYAMNLLAPCATAFVQGLS